MGNFINKNPDVVVDIPFVHDNDVKYEEELEIKLGYSFKHNSERQKQKFRLSYITGQINHLMIKNLKIMSLRV